jgi:hypothetical protein
MRTHVAIGLGALLLVGEATHAEAARRVLVVGAGECGDPALTSAVGRFHDEARGLLKDQLFEPDVVLDAVRPRSSRGLQDVQRQVESARTLLYGGENERGLELVRQALGELDRASPQVNPWAITAAALLVQSQLFKNLERAKEMNEAYRRLLRIDPTFALDPDAYPPSTLQAFEAARKEVARARKATLVVQSTPPGAAVFVDGKELGKTPLKRELLPGSYVVWLARDGRVGFPRRVDLSDVRRERELQVDVTFESAVSQQPPLCVSSNDDDEARKLGGLMVADEVVVVRNAASPGTPAYVSAVLYDASGQQLRNAGAGADALGNLATFIVTGEQREGVRRGAAPPPPSTPPAVAERPTAEPEPIVLTPQLQPELPRAPQGRLTPAQDAAPARVELTAPAAPTRAGVSAGRVAGYVLLSAGLAAMVAGGVVFGLGASDRDALSALTQSDGRLPPSSSGDYERAVALMPRVDGNRAVALSLLGAGAGVAAAGALGLLLFPAKDAGVALFPVGDGGALSVSGRF